MSTKAQSALAANDPGMGLRVLDRDTNAVVLDGTEDVATFRAKYKAYLVELDRRDFESGKIDKPPGMSWDDYWARGGTK